MGPGAARLDPRGSGEPLQPPAELRHRQQRLPGRQGRNLLRRRSLGHRVPAARAVPLDRGDTAVHHRTPARRHRRFGRSDGGGACGLRARETGTDGSRGRRGGAVRDRGVVVRSRPRHGVPARRALGRRRHPLPRGAPQRRGGAGLSPEGHHAAAGGTRRHHVRAPALSRPTAVAVRGQVLVALRSDAHQARERSLDRAHHPEVRTRARRAAGGTGRPSPHDRQGHAARAPGLVEPGHAVRHLEERQGGHLPLRPGVARGGRVPGAALRTRVAPVGGGIHPGRVRSRLRGPGPGGTLPGRRFPGSGRRCRPGRRALRSGGHPVRGQQRA